MASILQIVSTLKKCILSNNGNIKFIILVVVHIIYGLYLNTYLFFTYVANQSYIQLWQFYIGFSLSLYNFLTQMQRS